MLIKKYWALSCSILLSIVSIFLTNSHFYKFFLNRNGLSDEKVASFTKNEYGFLFQSWQNSMKYLMWLDAICWNFSLLQIFMIKQCVAFSRIVLGTLK